MPHAASTRLTLKLDGPKITADQFQRALALFFDLLDQMSEEMTGSPKAVRWIVSLEKGSGIVHADPEIVAKTRRRVRATSIVRTISRGVGLIERRAQRGKHMVDPALRTVRELGNIADGEDLRSVELQAPNKRIPISQKAALHVSHILGEEIEDYGTVEGRLQTLSERHRPNFAVYDALTDQPVRCYISERELAQAWRAFGHRVAVSGQVRYRRNGQPVSIKVESIYVFPPDEDLPTAEDVYGILGATQ